MRYLVEEKDFASRDYLSKITGQEKQIQVLERERQELDRLIKNKDRENEEMKNKIYKFRDRHGGVDDDYQGVKDSNDELMRRN